MRQAEINNLDPADVVLLPIQRVISRVGLSRATLYRMVDSGEFPRPVKLSPMRVAWIEAEVNLWIGERLMERGS